MKMIIGKESKEVFKEFEDFYRFITNLTKEDANGNNIVYNHLQLMNISRCANMVANKKALNWGRACKVKTLFC